MAKTAKQWLDVDHYMQYQKPNTDRSTWTRSNEWSFGVGVDVPKREFDKDKCPVCGGAGRVWSQLTGAKNERRMKKRNIKCPAECEWAYDF